MFDLRLDNFKVYPALQNLAKKWFKEPPLSSAKLRSELKKILDKDFINIKDTIRIICDDVKVLNLPYEIHFNSPITRAFNEFSNTCEINHMNILVVFSQSNKYPQYNLVPELEELKILEAFDGLLKQNKVSIHFLNDCSVEEIVKHLSEKQYELLHISSHGSYSTTTHKGYLYLEDLTGNETTESDFIITREIIGCKNPPSVIMLSNCESAKGDGHSGITGQLIDAGIPAVIGMTGKIGVQRASEFCGRFYSNIASGIDLENSFATAKDFMLDNDDGLFPVLYLSSTVQIQNLHKIDTTSPEREKTSARNDVPSCDIFYGRRNELKTAIKGIKSNQIVGIHGMGGIGKTAFTEYLSDLLLRKGKDRIVLIKADSFTNQTILDDIRAILFELKLNDPSIGYFKSNTEWLLEYLTTAITDIALNCSILFTVDNFDSFQAEHGGRVLPEYTFLIELFNRLNRHRISIIINGRYPIDELDYCQINLNMASVSDFYKKLMSNNVVDLLRTFDVLKDSAMIKSQIGNEEPVTLLSFVELLHNKSGGNYRYLEWLMQILTDKLNEFIDTGKIPPKIFEEVLDKMSKDIIFNEIFDQLNTEQKKVIANLADFRLPVKTKALSRQGFQKEVIDEALLKAYKYTLVEKYDTDLFYVNNLIKEMIKTKGDKHTFNHLEAGHYYWYDIQKGDRYERLINKKINEESLLVIAELSDRMDLITELSILDMSTVTMTENEIDEEIEKVVDSFSHEMQNINKKFTALNPNFTIEALNHYLSCQNYENIELCLQQVCEFNNDIGHYNETIHWYEKLTPFLNQPNKYLLHIYGSALIYLQQNKKGITVYEELLKKAENEKDVNYIAISNNSLAQCYLNLGENWKAQKLVEEFKKKYLDKYLETDTRNNDSESEVYYYLFYATYGFVMYAVRNKYNTSISYLVKALQLCPQDRYIHYCQILNHLGYCLFEKNKNRITGHNSELIEAIHYHKWVIDIYDHNMQSHVNRLPLTAANCALAKIYYKISNDDWKKYYMECRRLIGRYGYDFFNRDLEDLE